VVSQNIHTATDVGQIDDNLAIKSTRASQGLVQQLGIVGSTNNDDATALRESVKLSEKLVERLLYVGSIALIPLGTYRIQFIDEDNRGRLATSLSK